MPRLLAWNRLYLRRDAVPAVEREAQRLGLTPTALLAEIVETWARAPFNVRPRVGPTCRALGCGRRSTKTGLCRVHTIQERKGRPLVAVRPREYALRLGSLRLPSAAVARLRKQATRDGTTVAEGVRRALEAALRDPARLAQRDGAGGGQTVRLGALPMPAELAARLTEVAGVLGVSVAEVVRRALRVRSPE